LTPGARLPARLALGAAATLFVLTLAGYAGHWGPTFETIANFRLHLAIGAGVLAVVLGLAGQRRGAGFAVLSMVIAAAGLGPLFDPVERPGTGRPLTLLYANLHDHNPEPAALAAVLHATGADILITSETPRTVADGPGGLAAAYPYRLVHDGAGETLRTAIWSKYPLGGGVLYLNNTVAPTGAAATADLGGGVTLGLIGGHFSRPFERLHMIQAEALGPIAAKLGQPLIVAGDFNAAPWSRVVARAAEVTGTRILGGYRVTWKGHYQTPLGPLPEPLGHQIDHVLLSDGIGVEAVETLDLPGSDHRAILVRLRIPAP